MVDTNVYDAIEYILTSTRLNYMTIIILGIRIKVPEDDYQHHLSLIDQLIYRMALNTITGSSYCVI